MANTATELQDFLSQILGQGRDLINDKDGKQAELTSKGKELAAKGEDFLADKLGVEDTPEARAKLRKNVGIATGAGALAVLMSSRSRRKLATMGGLGALGVIAYKAHQAGRMPKSVDDVIGLLKGEPAEARANVLLQAMVAAAQADGDISESEQALIAAEGGEATQDLSVLLAKTPDPKAIAALATTEQERLEVYAVSCRVANGLNPKERDYLDALAMAMRLDPEVVAKVENDVRVG